MIALIDRVPGHLLYISDAEHVCAAREELRQQLCQKTDDTDAIKMAMSQCDAYQVMPSDLAELAAAGPGRAADVLAQRSKRPWRA